MSKVIKVKKPSLQFRMSGWKTASEVRRLWDDKEKAAAEEKLSEYMDDIIMPSIINEAQKGETYKSINLYDIMTDVDIMYLDLNLAEEVLKKLGYLVDVEFRRFIISWR